MGDQSEFWKDIKEDSKRKKFYNFETSLQLLDSKKIKYTCLSEQSGHYRIEIQDFYVDFWPTTGTFYCPKFSTKGRGVVNLIKFINRFK